MLVTCCYFSNILDQIVEHWSPYNCWNVIIAETQLALLVVAPNVHLTILIDSKCVRIATTNLFDEFVLQRHKQSWMEYLHALH